MAGLGGLSAPPCAAASVANPCSVWEWRWRHYKAPCRLCSRYVDGLSKRKCRGIWKMEFRRGVAPFIKHRSMTATSSMEHGADGYSPDQDSSWISALEGNSGKAEYVSNGMDYALWQESNDEPYVQYSSDGESIVPPPINSRDPSISPKYKAPCVDERDPISTTSYGYDEAGYETSEQITTPPVEPSAMSQIAEKLHQNQLISKALLWARCNHTNLSSIARKCAVTEVRTLILDNYDSYTYNLFQLLSVANGVTPVVLKNDEITFGDLQRLLYRERAFDNVVISPGPGSPTCSSDIGICMQLLQECCDIPILGVCMGHQTLGCAHGMKILHAPEPVHGRLSEVEHLHHPLFNGIPSGSSFKVMRYHSLILDNSSLPPELVPTAWTSSQKPISVGCHQTMKTSESYELDTQEVSNSSKALKAGILGHEETKCTNGGLHIRDKPPGINESTKLLMGISHKTWPHHGVQFHPESIATTHGRKLLENFRDMTRLYWEENPARYVGRNTSRRSFSTSKPMAHENNGVVPLRLRFKKFEGAANVRDASERLFSEIHGADFAKNTFWLDSSNVDQGRARFSYMGGKGGSLWRKVTYTLSNNFKGGQGVLRVENANGDVTEQMLHDGFFDFMNKETQAHTCRIEDYEQLPFDFVGGFVGYLGYELKCECGAVSNRHKSLLPDAAFFMVDRFVVVDHLKNDIYLVALYQDDNLKNALGSKVEGLAKSAQAWIDATAEIIANLSGNGAKSVRHSESSFFAGNLNGSFTSSKSRNEYVNDVEKCLKYISDGESYEMCLTTQMKKSMQGQDLLGLYLVLRQTNPAPYAAWLHFGEEGPCICCSSPERFLKLDQTGILEAKPIKGTMPRGKSPLEDEMLRSQLQQSEKDQAENLMIVDLLRNDLGRVCEPGSVHVPNLMALESYSTVHTLVSTIRGKQRDDVTPIECVKAAFPGGSMTGAPKLRTMEILDSIESSSRGVYSGAIGFFSFNSSFDLNIVIRTLVIHGGEVSIGAGGAVVALSDPESEYGEMLLKTKAPIRATHIFCSETRSREHAIATLLKGRGRTRELTDMLRSWTLGHLEHSMHLV